MLLARAEGLMSSMPTESPGISPVRGEGMVRTPAGNALSLDSWPPPPPPPPPTPPTPPASCQVRCSISKPQDFNDSC
jgi:hypothetical protein